LVVPFAQSRAAAPDSLIGLWGSEQVLGPRVRGELTIDARGTEWRARIAGFDVSVERKGGDLRLALPDGQGELRGQISEGLKKLTGHWIQPASSIFSQRYATPVEFKSTEYRVWTGEVHPLDERISFYIWIERSSDGALTARVRNPEFGWFSRASFTVTMKGDDVAFSTGQNQVTGKYEPNGDYLTLGMLNAPRSQVVFSRRAESNAVGIHPRTPQQTQSYIYHQPISDGDGWATASLVESGMDPKLISDLMQSVLAANPMDKGFLPIHSILIAQHGKLAVEEYFYGFDRQRPHDTRSAGKTIAPILVGVARDHGAKVEPNTRVYSLFPDYKPFASWDERKNKLTLEALMTMTPGLACDDGDSQSPGEENQMQSQTEQSDWYRYTLNLPMVRDSGGTTAIYCSAGLNLVGGVAERVSGKWNADLFYEYIAKPLQFGEYHLNLTPTGSVYTGGGAYLRPRDQLKLGQLYLAGGLWNGRRVIRRSWVEQSTVPHATFIKPVIDIDVNHQYGYGWHIHRFTVGGREYREYAAEGNGGQFVMVIPDLDMVIAVNGGGYGNSNWYRWGLEVLPTYLIPAGRRR
jgi:CubicO group peptidase (beta-lactamase class C family)